MEQAGYHYIISDLASGDLTDLTSLVISMAPQSDFTEKETLLIRSYLDQGGRFFLLADLPREDFPQLDELLDEWNLLSEKEEMTFDTKQNSMPEREPVFGASQNKMDPDARFLLAEHTLVHDRFGLSEVGGQGSQEYIVDFLEEMSPYPLPEEISGKSLAKPAVSINNTQTLGLSLALCAGIPLFILLLGLAVFMKRKKL